MVDRDALYARLDELADCFDGEGMAEQARCRLQLAAMGGGAPDWLVAAAPNLAVMLYGVPSEANKGAAQQEFAALCPNGFSQWTQPGENHPSDSVKC